MEQKSEKRDGVVCLLFKEERYLLALIEYSQSNQKWNGIGGFVNENESLQDAVSREMQEEIAISIDKKSLKYVGKVIENEVFTLHVFISDKWQGSLQIKDPTIKKLEWFTPQEMPYEQMWPDNAYWLPEILSGKTIIATVLRDVYTDIKPLTEKDVQREEVANIE